MNDDQPQPNTDATDADADAITSVPESPPESGPNPDPVAVAETSGVLEFSGIRDGKTEIRRFPQAWSLPGTIEARPGDPPPRIWAMCYGPEKLLEVGIEDPRAIPELLRQWPVTWVHVHGLGDAETIRQLGKLFDLHNLALEDVVHTYQRAKVDDYDEHYFIVLRLASLRDGKLASSQLSMFVGERFVLTLQEPGADLFPHVRGRIRQGLGRVRKLGPDYLAYTMIDGLIDDFFPVVDAYGERIEDIEDRITDHPDKQTTAQIHDIRHDMLALRRMVWPLREAVGNLKRNSLGLFSEETRLHLRDCADHCAHLIDLIETYRELCGGLMDAYLHAAAHSPPSRCRRFSTLRGTALALLAACIATIGCGSTPTAGPDGSAMLTGELRVRPVVVQANVGEARRLALLVGVGQYMTQAWNLPCVPTALAQMRKALVTDFGISDTPATIREITDASVTPDVLRANVARMVEILRAQQSPVTKTERQIVVYWVGHGLTDSASELQLFLHTTEPGSGTISPTLSAATLKSILAPLEEWAQVALVIDACRIRGLAAVADVRMEPMAAVTMLSCGNGQIAQAPTDDQPPLFTRELLAAMADYARQPRFNLLDVFRRAAARTKDLTANIQQPEMLASPSEIIIAKAATLTAQIAVVDSEFPETHIAATIEIESVGRRETTSGRLELPNLAPGRYRVSVTAANYLSRELDLDLTQPSSSTVTITIPLLPAFIEVVGQVVGGANPSSTTIKVLSPLPPTIRNYHTQDIATTGVRPDTDSRYALRLPPFTAPIRLEIVSGSDRHEITVDPARAERIVFSTAPANSPHRDTIHFPRLTAPSVNVAPTPTPTPTPTPPVNANRPGAQPLTSETFTNSIGMQVRRIRAGTFTMGDPEQGDNPPHRVTLTKDFYIGVHPVTNAQYRQFRPNHNSGSYEGHSLNGDDRPVVNVSWHDAVAFCEWLSEKEGRTYRLPTEAEWEYCCRAGRSNEQSKYPWGPNWPPRGKAGNYADIIAKRAFPGWIIIDGYDDGYAVTSPVGRFDANPWGLYDMGGNVWEWCLDAYDSNFCKLDATDPLQQSGSSRVLRGASWGNDYRDILQAACRNYYVPAGRYDIFGFRLVVC